MLISKIFLYDAGIIFIFSREEPSVCIIFCACCRELNQILSRHARCFFQHQTNVTLRFVFHQEDFNKVICFVSVVSK